MTSIEQNLFKLFDSLRTIALNCDSNAHTTITTFISWIARAVRQSLPVPSTAEQSFQTFFELKHRSSQEGYYEDKLLRVEQKKHKRISDYLLEIDLYIKRLTICTKLGKLQS